ncbi:Protein kinase-like domain protein [Moelleriella libera RCEF 2490]|uniref:Protein kinase-like domain protein n=1 Tax=Moelleriella libera RCEF 2490 TaxID=1081109 RepID=A0A168BIS1_9HYPO|nr:Protein kinase-like domain protein [Moelleriella libera RCEF 2490]
MNAIPVINSGLPPPWSVIEFTFSNLDADAELVVMCNHVRFVIHATEDGFASSPQSRERYLFFLKVAENYELDGYTVDDFYDWALEPLLPVLCEHTQTLKTGKATLHDFLHAPIVEYTLGAESDKLVLRPRKGHAETRLMFGVSQAESGCQAWPGYLPSEIQLDEEAAYDSIPRRVILPDGTAAFFKLMGRGERRILDKELRSYETIRKSGLPSSVRISRLLGLVKDESDTVFGLLLTHIDCQGQTLTCAVESDAPVFFRRQWIAEISEVVYYLHQYGLVWGDAKPDNVLVDGNQNAWVIDFGGGYTEGWVPKNLAGTVKGDLTALAKIADYVEGDPVDVM